MPTFRSAGGAPRRRGPEAGFTLIELVMALAVAGILATILLQQVQGNSRFVSMQASREEVQQNGRAALDLIAGDLRAVPSSALRDIQPHAVGINLPRGWGVLCNALTAATQTAYVLFPAGGFPAGFQTGAQHWGIALEQTASPQTSTGHYRYVAAPEQVSGAGQCDAVRANAGDASRYTVAGFTVGLSLIDVATMGASAVLLPGTQVMIYQETRYDAAASTSGPGGTWVRRMSGYSGSGRNMQPLAGPLPADTSLVLRYLQEDGVTAATTPADVRRIRIWLEVESRTQTKRDGALAAQQVDTVTTDVILRNR